MGSVPIRPLVVPHIYASSSCAWKFRSDVGSSLLRKHTKARKMLPPSPPLAGCAAIDRDQSLARSSRPGISQELAAHLNNLGKQVGPATDHATGKSLQARLDEVRKGVGIGDGHAAYHKSRNQSGSQCHVAG